MIVKILIIITVFVSGIILLYPDEIIKFSKGTTIKENSENDFSNIKDISINNIGNSLIQNFQKVGNKIENTINNTFDGI